MMGLALVVATLRALMGGRTDARSADALSASAASVSDRPRMAGPDDPVALQQRRGRPPAAAEAKDARDEPDVGNYWADLIRPTLRFMLPLCLLWSVLLTSQGVPSTLAAGPTATPIDASAGMKQQKIPLGPVASMVAVKQLGTNGGGWYGPNSAVPLENPTPFSNLLEMLAILLIPVSVAFMIGPFTRRRKFTALVFGSMLLMSVLSSGAGMLLEGHSAMTADPALMEGKEVRFGADSSALWATLTTQTSNGSVNAMHDSLSPLTGLVTLGNMLINAIWGGIGCGLQQFIVYLLLAVFLAGLMTGRTPELFGRKIEAPEIRMLSLLILLQPMVVLGFTALTLALPQFTANSNPGFHGISQVFYEYTSAFANNGSGFEGLGDASYWWNLTCTLVLMLGRYPALIVPLAVAASLARKRHAPEGPGSLHIETPTFALTVIAVIVILTLLQFMPALVLGPVAEHLSLVHGGMTP
jgi:K+-transporting ATPase ATPase A chain